MKSETPWSLSLTYNSVKYDTVSPQKKSAASIFRPSQNEELIFFGKQAMSIFGLNTFKITFSMVSESDLIKVGVLIT